VAADSQLVSKFKRDVASAAAKAFLGEYFTREPDRLNQAPFGPYVENTGDEEGREVVATDAQVRNTTDSLYGGSGTKFKSEFVEAVRDLTWKEILDLSQDPTLTEALPLHTSTENQGPPPNEPASITRVEFLVFMTMLKEIGRIDFGTAGLTGASFGSGDKYRQLWVGGTLNQPQWIALAKPLDIDGNVDLWPVFDYVPTLGWNIFSSDVRRYADLPLSSNPGNLDNLPSAFKAPNALYMRPPKFNGGFKELADRIARNHQGLIKEAADAVAEEIWGDIIYAEQKRAIAKTFLPEGSVGKPLTKKVKIHQPRKLTPTDFQCVLLERISALAAQHAPEYKHAIMVDTEAQPALVMNAVNHGADKSQHARALLDLCPDIQGLLVPHIKVSRLEYTQTGRVIPGSEKELSIPNFLTQTDIEKITQGDLGRAPGAGIKSFKWSLAGVQPAEVDNNITAQLVMHFQTVNDFFAGGIEQAGKKEPTFLDLIIASPTLTREPGSSPRAKPGKCPQGDVQQRQYDGVNFRIKVCAGWAVPDNLETIYPDLAKTDPQSGKMKADLLRDAIQATQVSLYLQQVRHHINFGQDGTVELTVDYQASLSGLLRGPGSDIFAKTPERTDKQIEEQQERLEKLEVKRKEYQDAGRLNDDPLVEKNKEDIEATVALIRDIREEDKLLKYKNLLQNLFKSDQVYALPIAAQELLLTPYSDLSPQQRAERAKRRRRQPTTVVDNQGSQWELVTAVTTAQNTEEAAKTYSSEASRRFVDIQTNYTGDPEETISVPFMYLGDLLDNVLSQIQKNQQELDFNFFLSDVEMVDPLLALQFKNIEDLVACGTFRRTSEFLSYIMNLIAENPVQFSEYSGVVQLMSIGDIPISLDAFQVWFKNQVVKKGREKYLFLHFVKDICSALVSKALASFCFGSTLNFSQRFDAQPLTLSEDVALYPGTVVSVKKLARAKQNLTCVESKSKLGLIIMPTDSRPKSLKGNFNDDLELGIYHNYLGSSCGLVKTINFNREDQPYLRESKIQRQGTLSADQLRELYSANISMVGNNLFQNGAYTYISPLVLPATHEQLELLGLHGYFLITGVSSVITESDYTTEVAALHEGIKFNQNQLIKPETYEQLGAEVLDRPYWPSTQKSHVKPPDASVTGPDNQQHGTEFATPPREETTPAIQGLPDDQQQRIKDSAGYAGLGGNL